MRKQCKQIILVLISVTIFSLYISSLKKISINSHKSLNSEDEILQKNSFCEPVNLTFSDSIASHYMTGKKGRVECDILNGTDFVEINDVNIFNEEEKKIDFSLIKMLMQQGVLSADYDDESKEADSEINDYFFSIKLNMNLLAKRSGIKENSILCSLEKYEKQFNISEKFSTQTLKSRAFKKKEDYTLYVIEHGYYNINCTNIKNMNSSIYDDSYYVLPRDMSKLMQERKLYQTQESKLKSELTYENDIEEKLDFLETLNQLKLEKKMNVLMFGFDSVSFQHLRRIFPRLYDYLTNKLENNVMFTSYNKVGVNTHPNMLPLLTGIIVDPISSINASSELKSYKSMDTGFYDKYPFIWHRYEKAGYLTGLQQDAPSIAVFNYLKKGFRLKPTAFYARPIWIKRKNSKKSDNRKCYHGRPLYKVSFDMIESFLDRMNKIEENSNIPYFIFNFLSEYTHDDFVVPSYIDNELTERLIRFEDKGYLDNTLFVVFSDHGVRLVQYSYKTQTGKIETNLPFISIRLPKILWNTVYQKNLEKNKNKLITHYDTYQTLRHFFHLNQNYTNELDRRQFTVNDKNVRYLRGISLLEKIPVNRSCGDAMIPDAYCGCLKQYAMTDDDFLSGTGLKFNEAAEYITDRINELTEDVRSKCVAFSLQKVEHVSGFNLKSMDKFQFVVILDPGDAWFEVNVKIDKNAKKKEKVVTLIGNVIRLSPYGDQANCVNDHILRNYCFCKEKL